MRLTNFLVRDAILPRLSASAAGVSPEDADAVGRVKEQVVAEMSGALRAAGCFRDTDLPDIVRAVMARERIGTTGIGQGIAIPHTRHAAIDRLVGTLALAPAGLPFRSLDSEPAFVFVLLLSPHDQPGVHLRALEAVVRTMRDEEFVRRLRACETRDEIWNLLETAAPGW
ncbi:pts iia-like nitrogen-regulatory protein : Phosphotransferase system mannitol/fructose-specifc IIA component (Ntr-type) OS=Singulisphaera acidiphila (strain ATCC BAA-1392 / DSM 18658 / VKM B-2454 / MOB10) GN=Sinac_3263 PE=4 SV=1: PTS_EIIA_2 [Gemmataceae bacterium]|nr:pts iia-like nitrogen-regulatory protein : Phosphotransferase system mannitol/fructose-specifc IIA component (Ntr-type) OS=Singulisphaera acidiphila (strain ATCC BAA-1392 / DSM 18658 / VKM B-2454 / MOB10) GN=Sinac_3263 PE=4 SV=1: PTS_EIIA_2 [Gemmataceae bacterium]VTU01105.1 pts iia-like nitrogen-regulatory protein : Phosphotransferase system mannitol/fructose-specifc IIA component (Ntr-type) OS=Singulisphaera acidiphila (strain ATCC BAA-1392 / DSM 18658 / VKM B-2454 / MOB10) GN=Sinac_3263 PE=4 